MKNTTKTKTVLYRMAKNFGAMRACEGEDDEEKKKEEDFTKRVNEVVHKALTERDKRMEKTMQKLIADGITAGLASLEEKIKAPTPTPDDKDGKGKKGGEESEAYKALSTKLAKIEKERDEEKRMRTEAEQKALRTEEARYMSTLLTENKVRPTMLAMATRDLHSRHLVRDDNGEIKWKNADGELVDPKVGWAEFAKTDEGKDLIMPKDGGGGAGSRNPGAGAGSGKPGEFTFGDLGARLLPKNT